MTELLTAAQMRAIEEAAIASGQVTGLELMERAGRGVVDAILDWRTELAKTSHRAVVLCGPGNNGGDGFVVARLLKERGWEVEVFLYGDETELPPDAAENARRWRALGAIRPVGEAEKALEATDLVLDALFGTGLTRPLEIEPWLLTALNDIGSAHQIDGERPFLVSVDIPSGVCADSGACLGDDDPSEFVVQANLCVTFHRPKIGHFLNRGPSLCGRLSLVDIGLNVSEFPGAVRALNTFNGFCDEPLLRLSGVVTQSDAFLDLLDDKRASQHKYVHGHALVLSGGPGAGGAARLAARGALRIGAGLVTVGCPPPALTENAARLDAVMLAPINDAAALLAEIKARKVKALCIGPGFGLGERLRESLSVVLEGPDPRRNGGEESHGEKPAAESMADHSEGRRVSSQGQASRAPDGRGDAEPTPDAAQQIPVVLDADALTEFREDPETLWAMLHDRCVLTPHEGEFGRLFPDLLAKLKAPAENGPAYSKVDATRDAAKRAGCVVLFKGPDTVIAHPNGRCSINSAHYDRIAPWLATAGSGDVLAGFITGLLARGLNPMHAAETAAWLHVECARNFGPGLIAEDLPEQLPAVFRDLGVS